MMEVTLTGERWGESGLRSGRDCERGGGHEARGGKVGMTFSENRFPTA